MSKPRLTKEDKKIRKELIKYHRNINKRERKMGIFAIIIALAIQELIKGKD